MNKFLLSKSYGSRNPRTIRCGPRLWRNSPSLQAKWFPWMSKPLLRWVETTTFWILARLGDSHLINQKKAVKLETFVFFFGGGEGWYALKLLVDWGLWRFNFLWAAVLRIFVRGFPSELVDDMSQIIYFYCKTETSTRTGGSPWRRETSRWKNQNSTIVEGIVK